MNEKWDVIIVGGGSAGLSAALTLGRARRRVLVADAGQPRNRFAAHMHGSLGHDGVAPSELLRRGREEVAAYGVTVRSVAVAGVEEAEGGLRAAFFDGGEAVTSALIAASGASDDLPDIRGIEQQWGTGVLHCPYCHGWEVRAQRIGVLSSNAMSLHQAELVRQWSDDLTFFTAALGELDPAVAARLRARGVRLIDTAVTEVLSDHGRLTGVKLADGRQVALDAVFTMPTARPHDEFLAALELKREDNQMGNFIAVDHAGKTSHPRVWAVGNMVSPAANVPLSIGAGAMAGGAVNMALVTEEFDKAVADGGHSTVDEMSPAEHWENQYAEKPRRWSGRVNPTMAEFVEKIPTASGSAALDLGCGEGADAVWLAEQGWRVTAVDISATATARGAAHAAEAGVGDRIAWVDQDLSTWETSETFDLVTATFFHSRVALPRTEILRRAAGRVRPGGRLLLISHVVETEEDVPPWARHRHSHNGDGVEGSHSGLGDMPAPAEQIAELALDPLRWEVVSAEIREREATGPDGQESALHKDGVVLMRRHAT